MIREFKDVEYEERLVGLNLTSLGMGGLRGDVTQEFKIVKGFDRGGIDSLFCF